MRCLVVFANPDPESLGAALLDAVQRGLETAGHEFEVIDLYGMDYEPCMSADEHRAYETIGEDHPDSVVTAHIASLRASDALIVIYPTWWSGLPAVLKGWLERTLLPGVGFVLHPRTRKLKPALTNIRRIVGVSTYGASRRGLWITGDGGRRTILRSVRAIAHRRCRSTWLAMHEANSADDGDRAVFLIDVEQAMANL